MQYYFYLVHCDFLLCHYCVSLDLGDHVWKRAIFYLFPLVIVKYSSVQQGTQGVKSVVIFCSFVYFVAR